jgi:hypothetical protein
MVLMVFDSDSRGISQDSQAFGCNLLFVNAIPHRELDLLGECAREAGRLADAGRVAAGFRTLHTGFTRCAALLAQGSAWAVDLSLKYDEALRRYMDRYGAKLLE